MSRLAYLHDIRFFCNYLISETDLTAAKQTSEITLKEFEDIKAVDINIYLDYCRKYKVETDKNIYVYENNNKTLARKKSSVSVMFKQLYRDQLISKTSLTVLIRSASQRQGKRRSKPYRTMRS